MKVFHSPTAGAHLRFHDLPGPGTPLLFVHGFGCASSCDYPRIAADPRLGPRRCLLVDLLGSGFSDRPEGFGYTLDAHARCLVELIDALELPALDLYGHSMGGGIAILAAALRPERIRRLVTSEPALAPSTDPMMRAAAAQSEADYVLHGHGAAIQAALAEGNPVWAGSLAASSALAIHRECRARTQGGPPSWRELAALPMARTLLFGEYTLARGDAAPPSAPGIALGVVPAAGHSMMWENPSGLAQALREALD